MRLERLLLSCSLRIAPVSSPLQARAAGAARMRQPAPVLFVDDLHRWSKAQQDALLQV